MAGDEREGGREGGRESTDTTKATKRKGIDEQRETRSSRKRRERRKKGMADAQRECVDNRE